MGREREATQVVAEMQARVARVHQKVSIIPQDRRVTVFYEVFDEPLMTTGSAAFIGQILEMAGGVNIFADLPEKYPQVSPEEVVKRNPAWILGPSSHGQALTPAQISQRPGWDRIAAVKHHRIYLLDGDIVSRPGPRLAEALETIAKVLYPELFRD
jgi:iron complex transport system substrate-binding protein